jgi:hypothetical protein
VRLILGGDSVDEDAQRSLPRNQIVGRDTVGSQRVDQKTAKVLKDNSRVSWVIKTDELCASHLPRSTGNAAGGVSVAHVIDVAQKLKFVSHSRDDGIQTIGDQSDLFIELGIATQRSDGDFTEFNEIFLDARSLLEESFNKELEKR